MHWKGCAVDCQCDATQRDNYNINFINPTIPCNVAKIPFFSLSSKIVAENSLQKGKFPAQNITDSGLEQDYLLTGFPHLTLLMKTSPQVGKQRSRAIQNWSTGEVSSTVLFEFPEEASSDTLFFKAGIPMNISCHLVVSKDWRIIFVTAKKNKGFKDAKFNGFRLWKYTIMCALQYSPGNIENQCHKGNPAPSHQRTAWTKEKICVTISIC